MNYTRRVAVVLIATCVATSSAFSVAHMKVHSPVNGKQISAASHSPLFSSNKDSRARALLMSSSSDKDLPQDAEIVSSDIEASDSNAKPSMTFFEKCDALGLALKPLAVAARDNAFECEENRVKRFLYTSKACALISLFILYRAYRGVFVILPAVFRQVYSKMEGSVEDPFDDNELDVDINPETGKVRTRTRITTSFLSGIITFSYVLTGALSVLSRFVRTTLSTSSVEKSFEAAADEVMMNEGKILKLAKKPNVNGEAQSKSTEKSDMELLP